MRSQLNEEKSGEGTGIWRIGGVRQNQLVKGGGRWRCMGGRSLPLCSLAPV